MKNPSRSLDADSPDPTPAEPGPRRPRGAPGSGRPAWRCTTWASVLLALWSAGPARGESPAPETFPCLVEPHLVVDASTAVEGILASVTVGKGDFVKQGEVVAKLESDAEQAALEHAALRAEMKAALAARQVNLARSAEKYERALKLSGNKFVSPDELDELRSAADLARLELAEQEENRQLAQIETKRMSALLAQRSIRSPVTGVVVERYLSAGEFAQAQPIVKLAQLDPLNVEAVLPGRLYGKVREGSRAQVILSEPFGETLDARVTMVEKVIDAASGTFGLRIELANPDYRIPAGVECQAIFPGEDPR